MYEDMSTSALEWVVDSGYEQKAQASILHIQKSMQNFNLYHQLESLLSLDFQTPGQKRYLSADFFEAVHLTYFREEFIDSTQIEQSWSYNWS